MKKVIFIERSPHKVFTDTFNIVNELCDLEIITPVKGSTDKGDIVGIKKKILKEVNLADPIYNFLKLDNRPAFMHYKGLYKYLKKTDPDIIHARCYYRPTGIVALTYGIIHKKKVLFSEEQRAEPVNFLDKVLFNIQLLLLRPLMNWRSTMVCVTVPAYRYLKKKGFKNLIYIPTPPYETRISSDRIDNRQKRINAICVARFQWLKAHQILIKAVHHLIKTRALKKQDIKVDLVGEGELMDNMKALCKKLDVDDIFNFVGYIDNKKLDKYYQEHNLFILPSVSEPIGMVVYEAISNGLPAIVSSNTGSLGAVKPGKNGYIFKSGDHKDLAKKILLLKDPETRQKFGEESVKVIEQEFSKKIIKKRWERLLR